MLKLKLRVPYDSAYVGVLTGTDGVNKISCPASTQFVSAVRRLDLPAGSYRLTKSVPVKQGDRSAVDAYGNTIISFTATDISPMSKPRVIVMHGGKMGNDGLLRPTEGTVRLAGTDLFTIDEDARAAVRAAKVGFVFQSFQLLANLTALENVMLPLELAGRRDARAAATRMLQRVGLGERLGAVPLVRSTVTVTPASAAATRKTLMPESVSAGTRNASATGP